MVLPETVLLKTLVFHKILMAADLSHHYVQNRSYHCSGDKRDLIARPIFT